MNIRVLIVADHPLLGRGLCQAVAQHAHLTLAGERWPAPRDWHGRDD